MIYWKKDIECRVARQKVKRKTTEKVRRMLRIG